MLTTDESLARYDAVTAEDANAAAREVWAPERLSVAGVGSDEGAFRATVEQDR
jgi:hypothetical protein